MKYNRLSTTISLALLIVVGVLSFSNNTTIVNAITDSQTDIDVILSQLQQLKETNEKYFSSSGWLYEVTESFVRADPANVVQNEKGDWKPAVYPEKTTIENWIELRDEKRTMGKGSFLKITDPDGDVLQILATDKTGEGGNLSLIMLRDYSPRPPFEDSSLATLRSPIEEVIDNLEMVSNDLAKIVSFSKDGAYFLEVVTEYQHLESSTYYPEGIKGRSYQYQIEIDSGLVKNVSVFAEGITGKQYLEVQATLLKSEIVKDMDLEAQQEYKATLQQICVEKEGFK